MKPCKYHITNHMQLLEINDFIKDASTLISNSFKVNSEIR